MGNRLFIGSLAYDATEKELGALFAEAGVVESVAVMTDQKTGRPRGFAFVNMANDAAAAAAIARFNGYAFRGRKLRVIEAEPPSNPNLSLPSRLLRRDPLTLLIVGVLAGALCTGIVSLALRVLFSRADPRWVMVAPFEMRGSDENATYVGHAVAEAVAINLATSKDLHVLPVAQVTDVDKASGSERAKRAKKSGAGRLVVGSITRAGKTVTIHVTVIDSAANKIVWGTQKEGSESDLTALAAALGRDIAMNLGVIFPQLYDYVGNLSGGAQAAASVDMLTALGAVRRGEWQSALLAIERVREAFPDDVSVVVLRTHALLLQWDANPSAGNRRELDESLSALRRMDPKSPYAEVYRAYLLFREGRAKDALPIYTDVLQREDLSPAARAWVLRYRAAAHEAMKEGNQQARTDLSEALNLDPANAWTAAILSDNLRRSGHLDEALVRARQSVALMPSFWRNYQILGTILSATNRWADAVAPYERACALSNAQFPCALLAVSLQKSNNGSRAASVATSAALLVESVWGAYNLACYWALAGNRTQALQYLHRAVELGFADEVILTDNDLAILHSDREFVALVGQLRKSLTIKEE